MKGVVTTSEARRVALEEGLDLVQIGSDPQPIAKIMDYGKERYRESIRSKKSGHVISKEVKVNYSISDHDLYRKINQALSFIKKKYVVSFSISVKRSTSSMVVETLKNKILQYLNDNGFTCAFKEVDSQILVKIDELN